MITYLIIDDEHIAHDIVKGYCDNLPNFKFVKSCYNAFEAIEVLNSRPVDLIFLDLNMPKLKGFDFLKSLSNPPKVIVTSAYQEYALEGYELNVIDYLLKPFGFDRFLKAINKLHATSSTTQSTTEVKTETTPTLFFKSNKKLIQVAQNDVLFIEATGNYCKLVTKEETIIIREKLSELSSKFPKDSFIQVHKSFIIATQHIKFIEGNRIHILDHIIPIGRTYKLQLQNIIGLK